MNEEFQDADNIGTPTPPLGSDRENISCHFVTQTLSVNRNSAAFTYGIFSRVSGNKCLRKMPSVKNRRTSSYLSFSLTLSRLISLVTTGCLIKGEWKQDKNTTIAIECQRVQRIFVLRSSGPQSIRRWQCRGQMRQ